MGCWKKQTFPGGAEVCRGKAQPTGAKVGKEPRDIRDPARAAMRRSWDLLLSKEDEGWRPRGTTQAGSAGSFSRSTLWKPDGVQDASSQREPIRHVRHTALQRPSISPSCRLPLSQVRRESQGDLGGQPVSLHPPPQQPGSLVSYQVTTSGSQQQSPTRLPRHPLLTSIVGHQGSELVSSGTKLLF